MSDTHRFFVAANNAVCEQIRTTLNAAWGLPNEDTQTCFLPAAQLPHDQQGRPMLAVDAPFCDLPAVADVLPGAINSGAVWEITREQYDAQIPRTPTQ